MVRAAEGSHASAAIDVLKHTQSIWTSLVLKCFNLAIDHDGKAIRIACETKHADLPSDANLLQSQNSQTRRSSNAATLCTETVSLTSACINDRIVIQQRTSIDNRWFVR